ncbi:MAG TPA: cytochrome C oxidase subunit IV family protein [Acidimicrobiales bacterium]|jgi:cytochrome c oxidase subunit 4
MTATLEPEHIAPPDENAHRHPSDFEYVKVALVLMVFTSIEIFIPYHFEVSGIAFVIMLLLMATKFGVVTAFFMHLRFDSHLFRRVFFAGVFLAVFVYLIVMSTFHLFGHDSVTQPLDERPPIARYTH